nr:MAG TPA: hypothetical protein [Caudoviricetes sp.]
MLETQYLVSTFFYFAKNMYSLNGFYQKFDRV